MTSFFKKLISNSNEVSSRRFIAVVLLPFYIAAIVIGLCLAWIYNNFNYFVASLLAAGIPIMIAFFLLTWEHVKDIVKAVGFNKKDETQFFNDTQYIDADK